ncbi:NAD(P)-binding domain-containing protein [Streptomyces platensis]|uniref:NAD(P)-binding domain-containing protein n=1 Tax=Streptomyces platensis TaxID=58346 RepID=UPI00369D3DA8
MEQARLRRQATAPSPRRRAGDPVPRGDVRLSTADRYNAVRVCADNQEVVDRSEVVLIAVRRQDRDEALAGLRVDGDKTVVNVTAGVGNDDLRRTLATDAPLIRVIHPANSAALTSALDGLLADLT